MTWRPNASPGICPVCGGSGVEQLLFRPNVPILLNRVYERRDNAKAAATGSLNVFLCRGCGFIFNRDFDPDLMRYDSAYENDQGQSPAFRDHMQSVATTVLRALNGDQLRVVEVGCGQGHFLELLVAVSGGRVSARGFDPAFRDRPLPSQVRIQASLFDQSSIATEEVPDAVIARHVIEHVPRPVEFLKDIRESLGSSTDWMLFLETPNVEWILDNLAIHDFFYEHCSYFSAESLQTALRAAGFTTINVEHVFDGQYLLAMATPRTSDFSAIAPQEAIQRKAEHFRTKYSEVESHWVRRVEAAATVGPVVVWGAGAKGVTFSLMVDREANLLSGLVDINPAKQGRYVPVTGLPVCSPRELVEKHVRTVLVMNPKYRREVETQLSRLGCQPALIGV